jgi:FkbM family methyltransferase
VHAAPPYLVRDTLSVHSLVIDCGLGADANFSQALMTRYGAECHGVDPTRKHQAALSTIAAQYGSLFRLHPIAVAGHTGLLTFYESLDQVSGSVFDGHVNSRNATSYTVPSMTIQDLMASMGKTSIDLLKLDIEGAEYEVLAGMDDQAFTNIGQLIVEFHHHCVTGMTADDTKRAVARLVSLGYRSYSMDSVNYLFFRRD